MAQERQRRWGSPATVPASQVIDGDHFAFGETVEISGTINGNLYASGGQVVIDGRVNGDVLSPAAESVCLEPFLRMCGLPGPGSDFGNVGRNLTVAGGNVEMPHRQ